MSNQSVRVRFAPSPTGFMHLGNVQSALLNFIFSRQKKGAFILRIEDTDQQRNVDPQGAGILRDLSWLTLSYDEGPSMGGPYGPYFQSQRHAIYTDALNKLKSEERVYPCFCSSEELEKKRQRQLALKQPPRYDRACLLLNSNEVQKNFAREIPFIWRFKLDHERTVSFYDLAHKTMHFELKHFSDVPLTRQDGSFTFLFANFVDDVAMKITHVFRGEDHLTNTAAQIALYEAFQEVVPVFWHLPILGNIQGKKLSKRDFGFSLQDLRDDGFLPEALLNYLGIIGRSVAKELLSLEELIDSYPFEHVSSTGQIKYDVEKLKWINHHWIMNYDLDQLTEKCRPFILQAHPSLSTLSHEELKKLIAPLKQELVTLKQSAEALSFIIQPPQKDTLLLEKYNLSTYKEVFRKTLENIESQTSEQLIDQLKSLCKEHGFSNKDIFSLIRIALTGKDRGPSVQDLLHMLPMKEVTERLKQLIT